MQPFSDHLRNRLRQSILSKYQMRNLIDIVLEYQQINSPDWECIPDRPQDARSLGQVLTKAGQINISSSGNIEGLAIWGTTSEGTDVAFINLVGDVLERYTILKHAYVLPEFKRHAIISEMINFIIRTMKTPVINDTQISEEGEHFTKYLCSKFDTSIVYLPTGETFKVSEVGEKKTKDGITVIYPKNDSASQIIYDPSSELGQRFFYLWETQGNVRNIIEGKEYIYGFDMFRHTSRYGAPIRYFYDDDAP